MKWSEKSLDELGFVGRGKSRHRPRNAEHLYGGPFPFIQTADVKHSELYVTNYEQTYSEAGLAQSKLWPPGTLCITIAANIAESAILGLEACFPDSVIGFIADEAKSDARFIKYTFDTLKRRYQQVSQGAAQDNLSMEKLLSIKLKVPNAGGQTDIADILSAYDELMENNRRRVGLLEDAARLLYQEWFIRLRFPGHEHTPISQGLPRGWKCMPLNEICPDLRDAANPADLEPNTPYIGLEHIPRRSITLNEWGTAEDVSSIKLRYRTGDILFGKIRPYFHKVGFTLTDGVASSDAIVLRPLNPLYYGFSLLTLSSDWFVNIVSKTAKEGSKMPRADWNLMERHPVAVPSPGLLESLNETVLPMLDQLRNLSFQNQKLRAARDLLLPRLMSGEIEV